jgi:hypothetical protein
MLEAPSLGAHGADLPISYTHELAADPNNGDTSSRAHEATPTQWESNESFAIGHLLGSDTDQEVQNLGTIPGIRAAIKHHQILIPDE